MKKIRTLLLALVLIPSLMFGQKLSDDFTVSVSEPFRVVDAQSKEYLALDNGNVISAKMYGEKVFIQLFHVGDMKEIARNEYEDMPKYTKFIDVINVNNRIFYIYQAYNKKQKNFTVYSREINIDEASFMEQKVLFTSDRKVANQFSTGEITRSSTGGFFNVATGPKFMVHQSYDASKVMITYRSYPREKNDALNYDDIGFYVFDNGMELIWGQEVKMPYTEAQINNVAYSVSSKGNGLMLVANRETKTYQVISVTKGGDVKTKDLGVSADKIVRTMKIRELANGNFLCAGFYANGIEYNFMASNFKYNINGLMYFKVSEEGDLLQEEYYDFTEDFLKQNLSEKQKEKLAKREKEGKAGIADLLLLDVIIKEDGSTFFLGERQFTDRPAFGPNSNKTYYKFMNALLIKVNKGGELAWMRKLPKFQYGFKGRGQLGVAYMEGKTADYITYVDNPKNINLDPSGGVPERHVDEKGGFLTAYKVDHESGDVEKHTICELTDIKGIHAYQFNTNRIVKSSDGVFLMEVYIKGKKDAMVKFELN
jgi:hypothetical protein